MERIISPSLFIITIIAVSTRAFLRKPLQQQKPKVVDRVLTVDLVYDALIRVEELVQRDENARGIGSIKLPLGELQNAAMDMLEAKHVAIITGFPCMIG